MRHKFSVHAVLTIAFLVFFLLLNRPEVILLSHLGAVVWYPATGLMLSLYLGVSPVYSVVGVLALSLAGKLIYGQPLSTWSETVGAVSISALYGAAAYVLRQPLRIDLDLSRRRDVSKYLLVTTTAALLSTASGVLFLVKDGAIAWKETSSAAIDWFLGDEIGILGVAPFLLIHVFPWVRDRLAAGELRFQLRTPDLTPSALWRSVEAIGQALAGIAILVLVFMTGADELLYLVFVPVIWAASRQGIRRVTSCLLGLNFGIVLALHFFPLEQDLRSGIGLLMFVVSAVGLLVGSLVSERHRISRELLEANSLLASAKHRAEEASRVKSQFLANMSHEIRTPLNGVLGTAELLMNTNLTSEQLECVEMLKSSGVSLLSVINDILDFSKVEKGKLALDRISFSLLDTVSEAIQITAPDAHQKQLELAYEIDPEIPEILIGDPGRLRQILLNLVGNAIKFTSQGEVVLRVGQETHTDRQITLHFVISDTGIGIPREKHAVVFEAFAQADGSTTRRYGGTGLGLAICSQLIELMEGRIWLHSEVGTGSTFHFTAKFESSGTQPDKVEKLSWPELQDIRILLVDDNGTNREILLQTVRHWGMRASVAESGEIALKKIEHEANHDPFRLIIIDVVMPGMDGFELAQRITKNPYLSAAIVMLLSSPDRNREIGQCKKLGIENYLSKPVCNVELINLLRSLLSEQRLGRPSPRILESEPEQSEAALRILVAEDNLVNQKVIVTLLRSMGHNVSLAEDGEAALRMLSSAPFDLVFMDIQMPNMDGLSATRKIRAGLIPALSGIPIVAITAHAMKGDKERCLAAGMDEYISKPVSRQAIKQVIAKLIGRMQQANRVSADFRASDAIKSWNSAHALARVDGNQSLLTELIEIFLKEHPQQLEKLRRGIAARDAEAVRIAAHTLKGELGYLGLHTAEQKAKSLEIMGRDRQFESAHEIFLAFESDLRQYVTEISANLKTLRLAEQRASSEQTPSLCLETGPDSNL